MSDPIQILIADDHPFVRTTLAHFLDSMDEISVVGEVPDGAAAVAWVQSHQPKPDVVLMDYNMPHMNGAEATREILTEHPEIVVIGLSMHHDGPVKSAMLEAGAAGFLTKGVDQETLLSTIRDFANSNGSCLG